MDAAAGSSTPQGDLVKVQLMLAQEKEVVKRRSKRHEYVEVDGFHFRRKRRAPSTPAAAAAAAAVAADGGADAPAAGYRSPAAGAHGTLQLDACAGGGAKASPLKAAAQYADAGMAGDQQQEGDREQQPAAAPADAPGDTAEEAPALPNTAGEAYDSEAADLMDAADDPDVAAATAAAAAAAAAAEAAAASAAAAAREVAAMAAVEAAAASAAAAAAGEEAAAGGVAAGEPVSFSMLPSELCLLVHTFLSGELQRLPSLTAEAAAQAADAAVAQLVRQLLQRCAPGSEDAAAAGADQPAVAKPRMTVLPYQVVQLKAKLHDKHAKLLQEQAAWVQLLQQYDALLAVGGTEEEQQQQEEEEQQQQQQAAAPAADAMQVDAAQEEEGQLEAGARPDAAGAVAVAPAGAAAASPGPVSAEQEGVLRGVTLKVEVLTALVAKMEHLVSRAEATARSLQAGYRAEKFAMFPHVDSPAALIKSLTASQQQHAGGASRQ